MGKLFWQISVSIDGFMAGPGDDLERTAGMRDPDFEKYASRMLETIGAFVIGRRTYDVFLNYWPTAEGRDAEILNSLPKLVASRTLSSAVWNNARVVNHDLAAEIEILKRDQEKDIAVFGSANLASSLAGLGLIDEFRLIVTPFILGGGTSAFGDFGGPFSLRLARTEPWSSGAVLQTYTKA